MTSVACPRPNRAVQDYAVDLDDAVGVAASRRGLKRSRSVSASPGARVCDSQQLRESGGVWKIRERLEVRTLLRLTEPRSGKKDRASARRSDVDMTQGLSF